MRTSASPVTVLSAGDRRSRPERGKLLKVSNRLSTCHKTKQVRLLKSRVRVLLSTDNSYPLPYIFSGLFSCCKCHLGSHKATKKKLLRGAGREENKRCRESHKKREVRWVGGSTRRRAPPLPKGYRWRGRRTRGEINSARPYLAAAPCWVSAEHAVLGKSPFLPLFVTPRPFRHRNPRLAWFPSGYPAQLFAFCFPRRAQRGARSAPRDARSRTGSAAQNG